MCPHDGTARPLRVAFVNMPFAAADTPSIQCGLLKALLRREGHSVDVHYLNLELAAELGSKLYEELAHLPKNLLLGEWLFSVAAFGPRSNEAAYRQAFPSLETTCQQIGVDFERLCELRNSVLPSRIEGWADDVDWSLYQVVGFTCMFEQNAAAFALARSIKKKHPQIVILFGGANFDGEMGREHVRAMPFIDYAVCGEGDIAVPRLLECLAAARSPLEIPGVIGRRNGVVTGDDRGTSPPSLDELPDPDYDEYFETLSRLGRERILDSRPPMLVVESARGCWWGQKRHCTFCGLNRSGIGFRSKSPRALLGQLRRLSSRYKVMNFEAVDNIMDHRYPDELFEPLAREHWDYRFFYEVKSNLKPEQIRAMRRAGVVTVQPGIESLSSDLLSLMGKGVTALQNVRFLKWAHYYGLRIYWNILAGFPGELADHYEQQRRMIPMLRHLPPPEGYGNIWLQRFSPYFTDPSYPIGEIRPFPAYRHVYPAGLDLDKIAYFFECTKGSTLPPEEYQPLFDAIESWKSDWQSRPRPALVYQRSPDWIQIIDRRSNEVAVQAFGEMEAAIYELCGDRVLSAESILRRLKKVCGIASDRREVEARLEDFCESGMMLEDKGRYLSLALPAHRHW